MNRKQVPHEDTKYLEDLIQKAHTIIKTCHETGCTETDGVRHMKAHHILAAEWLVEWSKDTRREYSLCLKCKSIMHKFAGFDYCRHREGPSHINECGSRLVHVREISIEEKKRNK